MLYDALIILLLESQLHCIFTLYGICSQRNDSSQGCFTLPYF